MSRGYLQDITFVDFYGKPIVTGYNDEFGYVVPMKHIIEEHIGLDWKMQKRRMSDNPLYNPVIVRGDGLDDGLTLEHDYPDEDIPVFARNSEYTCLPVSELNLFLCQINTLKARPEVQETLFTYQKECGAALHDYWFRGLSINSRKDPSRISADRHDWCPRQMSTKSLEKACGRYAIFAQRQMESRLNPDEILQYTKTVISQVLDIDSEMWENQTMTVSFILAFMERAAFDILYLCIEKSVAPEDLQDVMERNLNNAWENVSTLVVAVQNPYSPFPGVGRGSPRELV